MAVRVFTVTKCTTETTLTNCAIVNEKDFSFDKVKHIEITTTSNRKYVFTLKACLSIPSGQMGFSLPMRKWAELSLNQALEVRPYIFNPNLQYIAKIVLEVDFLEKKTILDPYDSEKMAKEFVSNFCNQAFSVGQMMAFNFQDMKLLKLVVKEMEVHALFHKIGAKPHDCNKSRKAPRRNTQEISPYVPTPETNVSYSSDEGQDEQIKSDFEEEQTESELEEQQVQSEYENQVPSKGEETKYDSFSDEESAANIEKVLGNEKSTKKRTTQIGLLLPNSAVVFEKAEGSAVNLVGKAKGKTTMLSIINPDWNFQEMGIGGLDDEFSAIFRRAFASRVYDPEFVQKLGLKHVRGILLYGPPGTGKTLMARQIGKMLNGREPKIVNGPQILDKYVGESEANIRRLFAEAEEEEKRLGPNSGLHIIIFDEIDAICKTRGSMAGSTGVHDTVVNQLLSKIDGVESLNNILVIGMTNRKDMIDEALIRPGRLEVQVEIGLPDAMGRLQILNIHTALMKQNNKLADDVDLEELAAKTKNFSGAEIEGLARAALSTAMNRLITYGKEKPGKVEIDPEAPEKIKVCRADFMHALKNDIKPAFGTSAEQIERLISQGIICWGMPVTKILEDGQLFIQQARSEGSRGLVSVLLEGLPNSGKTALAAKLALSSDFPFVRLCTPEDMVGYSEVAKCQNIKKIFDDAYKSQLSCIIVDSIERLLDYGAIGPRYSNLVLQALLVLLKKEPPQGRKLLVLCTSSRKVVLEEMEMLSTFTSILRVPYLSSPEHLINVLEETSFFRQEEIAKIQRETESCRLLVGIKKLLAYIDLARQASDEHRVTKFLSKLKEEDCLERIYC